MGMTLPMINIYTFICLRYAVTPSDCWAFKFPAQYLHVSYRLYTPKQSAPLYSVSSSDFYLYPAFVQRARLLPSLRSPVIYQRGAEHLMARNTMITVGLVMKRWQQGSRFVLNSFPLIFFPPLFKVWYHTNMLRRDYASPPSQCYTCCSHHRGQSRSIITCTCPTFCLCGFALGYKLKVDAFSASPRCDASDRFKWM